MKDISPVKARKLVEAREAGYYALSPVAGGAAENEPHEQVHASVNGQIVVLVRWRLRAPYDHLVSFRYFLCASWEIAEGIADDGGPPGNGIGLCLAREQADRDARGPLPATEEEAVALLRTGDPCRIGPLLEPARYLEDGWGFGLSASGRYGHLAEAYPPNEYVLNCKLVGDKDLRCYLDARREMLQEAEAEGRERKPRSWSAAGPAYYRRVPVRAAPAQCSSSEQAKQGGDYAAGQ
jgi:hypothetical protein